jgi:hypothetical protein
MPAPARLWRKGSCDNYSSPEDYQLRFGVDNTPSELDDVLGILAPFEFDPVIVNAQAGLVFRF